MLPELADKRKGFFISTAASPDPDIFAHITPVVKSFFNTFDCPCTGTLTVNNLEAPDDILKYPERLAEAFSIGKELML